MQLGGGQPSAAASAGGGANTSPLTVFEDVSVETGAKTKSFAVPSDGLYFVTSYQIVKILDAGGSQTWTLTWNDGVAQTIGPFPNSTAAVGNGSTGFNPLYCKAGTTISVIVTQVGGATWTFGFAVQKVG